MYALWGTRDPAWHKVPTRAFLAPSTPSRTLQFTLLITAYGIITNFYYSHDLYNYILHSATLCSQHLNFHKCPTHYYSSPVCLMESIRAAPNDEATAEQQESSNRKGKAPVVRHSRTSKRLLQEWFTSHSSWPYPTDQEKESLSEQTGLTVRQVSYWFVNSRRRNGKKLTKLAPTPDAELTVQSLANYAPPGEDGGDSMTPLDRWRHSPPEKEPAPLHAISRAVSDGLATVPGTSFGITPMAPIPGSFDGRRSRIGSVSSFDFSSSAASSESSGNSNSSGSITSLNSQHSRRSRRRPWRGTARRRGMPNDPTKSGENRPFQCTFCTDTFKTKYDWTRHEGTLHFVLERWACLPFGPKALDPAGGPPKCALCGILDPSDEHLHSHDALECTIKPLNARVFRRKDHLRQHLRLVHGISEILPTMNHWKSQMSKVNCRCGFCGERFTVWSHRNDHLAEHFKSGVLMKDWRGCRGLDAAVSLLVENAMPPYLIGNESTDPDPFSASKGGSKTMKSTVGAQFAPTSFAALTAKLGDYVRAAKASGLVITDDLLRNEARLIFFGDEDPWNSTPADNAQWLGMFKIGYGLVPSATEQPAPQPLSDKGQTSQDLLTSSTCGFELDPFTAAKIQRVISPDPATMHLDFIDSSLLTDNFYLAPNTDVAVPWSWQAPECLLEFRQMGQLARLVDHSSASNTPSPGQDAQQLQPPPAESSGLELSPELVSLNNTYGLADFMFPYDFNFDMDGTGDQTSKPEG